MAWFDEAVFYHIYPLGLAGAPRENHYEAPVSRLRELEPWIDHIRRLGCTALYIGPLFESGSHGYDTTDYRRLDSRLGTNEDLKAFVARCHEAGLRVVFDGVFNHTGRDFFAFADLRQNRESSPYRDWYCNVNFWGNNAFGDGFSYQNWGGHDLLAKLNQRNPEVQGYICDTIRFWVSEFDVDGIRLDAADVLDFDFMRMLRRIANEVKPDFWLMGEVIHGDYTRWVNGELLHAVTNYTLHKALYSGHNDHNYFEIAHTVRRLYDMSGRNPLGLRLYNFADNHDVERLPCKLRHWEHQVPIYILAYTLPGVPSVYYGSEFAIEGRKEQGSDWSLRPQLSLDNLTANAVTNVLTRLGQVRCTTKALSYGSYRELVLTNRQYAFARELDGITVLVAVNNDDNAAGLSLPAGSGVYRGALTGQTVSAENGRLQLTIAPNSGEIWLPEGAEQQEYTPVDLSAPSKAESEQAANASAQPQQGPAEQAPASEAPAVTVRNVPYEEMSVPELQACILAKMAKNGPVTDYMRRTVDENTHHGSLLNWVRSFR